MLPDIKIFKFKRFKQYPHINHGVLTRSGGISNAPFDSLNIGLNSGDEKEAVAENRKRMAQKMGGNPLVFLNQVHGDGITLLKKEGDDPCKKFEPGKEIFTSDGIITDIGDLSLVIQVADCQAVLLYEPEKKVIGNVHSGWRGSVKNIIGKAVEKMIREFGCNPDNIIAGISPSLGPCCSEFVNYTREIPKHLWKYKIKGRDYFDFWKMSRDQLMEKGVKKENIENMEICTRCNPADFYSFRGEKRTGRFACFLSITQY